MNKVKIVIGKVEFNFHFGLGFFGELKDNQGIGIEEIQEGLSNNAFKLVPVLMFESAKYSAFRRGVEFNKTVFDFIDIIDDDGGITSPSFISFIEALTKSMTKDVPKGEVAKKKPVARSKK